MDNQNYFSVARLAVPITTKWQPSHVYQFTQQLVTIGGYLTLSITSTAKRIEWAIDFATQDKQVLQNTLKTFHPNIEWVITPKGFTHVGYYAFHIHTAYPCCWSLKTAQDFKDRDPLAAVVEAMQSVQSQEVLVYELSLCPPEQNYPMIAERLFNPSAWQWAVKAGMRGVLYGKDEAEANRLRREDERELSALKDLALEKFVQAEGYFLEAVLSIKVRAASLERAKELANLLVTPLSQYDGERNYLLPAHQESFPLVLSAREIAALWHLPTDYCVTRGVVWAKPMPTVLFQPPPGGKETDYVVLGKSDYLGRRQPVYLAYKDRKNHVNIVGKSEMGKSTLIHNLVCQDMLNGQTVGVIDPKGDLITQILASIPPEREKDVILFDVADKAHVIGLNLLALPPGVSPDDTAGRILALIKKFFVADWPGEQTEGAFYAAILTLLYLPGSTLMDLSRVFNDEDYRKRVLSQVDDVSALEFWDDYQRRSAGDRIKIATPVITRARRFYRDRTLQRIICQSKGLNFRRLIDTNKIFLASLAGVGEIEAHTLGALLITKFQLAVMSRTDTPEHQRRPVYLYIDEVQNFATHSLGAMFSQGRSFGLSLATANQYFSQLPGETLEAVLGNVGTNICFGVGETTARHLAGLMRPEFTTDNLQQLDKYSTAVKMQKEGQTLPAFLLHTLPPPALPDDPTKIDRIRQHSRQTYGRPASEVDAELKRRYDPGEPDQSGAAPSPTDPTQPPAPGPTETPLRGDIDLENIFE